MKYAGTTVSLYKKRLVKLGSQTKLSLTKGWLYLVFAAITSLAASKCSLRLQCIQTLWLSDHSQMRKLTDPGREDGICNGNDAVNGETN